ncbi:MAG: exodeoxyribonuclease VII small subunit [Bacteroidales bacterium]|nr:exodeoxyribonuclease VII small subunit [Bacteroidales bacterium]
MTKKQPTYSEAISELENILAEIENNEPDVDELTEKVKRAAYLLRFCQKKLRKASEEVTGILKNMEEEEE